MRALALLVSLTAAPLMAQDAPEDLPNLTGDEVISGGITVETLEAGPGEEITLNQPRAVSGLRVRNTEGAILRGLDKVSGSITDLDLAVGESAAFGSLTVSLAECRVPEGNPTGDAFAHVTILARGLEGPAFEGWMIASSPALSALDHPRYDVWVMRCSNV